MTDTGRTKATRRTRRGGSQAIIAALILLGVVASVILLLTDSVQWLRLGIVIALWAAIIGAFAMTKYRRDSTADQVKARDLQTVYELQLEREIAARREYELGVEARVRGEIGADSSELRALRTELASLRRSLEVLFDGALPEDRAAIVGEAMRMRELADRSYSGYQPAPSGLYVPGRAGAQSYAAEPSYGRAPFATPADEPVTAETSVIHGEFDSSGSFRPAPEWMTDEEQAPSAERDSDSGAGDDAGYGIPEFDVPSAEPEPYESAPYESAPYESAPYESGAAEQETFEPVSFDDQEYPADHRSSPEADDARPEPLTHSAPDAAPTPAMEDDAPVSNRRSRRRAAEDDETEANGGAHSSGRSVADILAGISGSTDSGPVEVGRRRRRAE